MITKSLTVTILQVLQIFSVINDLERSFYLESRGGAGNSIKVFRFSDELICVLNHPGTTQYVYIYS
jgi:hypothetical protein